MKQVFSAGQKVQFNNSIRASAPVYAGQVYTIIAATAQWEVGERNEWYGDYLIQSATGEKSVTRQSCLEVA